MAATIRISPPVDPHVPDLTLTSMAVTCLVLGLLFLARPRRCVAAVPPTLLFGLALWVLTTHGLHHGPMPPSPVFLIFSLGSLAVYARTGWVVVGAVATGPALVLAMTDGPQDHLWFRVLGDWMTLALLTVAVHVLSRRHRRVRQALSDLAGTDPLTGLANRRRLEERAQACVRAAQFDHRVLAAALVDLDHFKQINDRHGHALGDDVLVTVSAALHEVVTERFGSGAVVARTGGEELLVLAPVADRVAARALGELLRRQVAACDTPVPVTCSVGVAAGTVVSRQMDDVDVVGWLWALVAQADGALYRAKQGGRDRVELAPARAVTIHRETMAAAMPVRDLAVRLRTRARAALAMLSSPSVPEPLAPGRLTSIRVGGLSAVLWCVLFWAVVRWSSVTLHGTRWVAAFEALLVVFLVHGVLVVVKPRLMQRIDHLVLLLGVTAWTMAPQVYPDPEVVVSPTHLLLICGVAALICTTARFVVVLLAGVPAIVAVLTQFGSSPAELVVNTSSNWASIATASLGIHLLRRGIEIGQRELAVLAVTDPLTALPNRRHLQERSAELLDLARERRGQVAVLLVDLDRFKTVNDRHGHAAGDALLRTVASTLTTVAGEHDLVARSGGEEFLLVSVVDDPAQATAQAERVRRAVERVGEPSSVTCSIGVAVAIPPSDIPVAAEWMWSLTAWADGAMYRAKRSGRNRVVTHDGPPGAADSGRVHGEAGQGEMSGAGKAEVSRDAVPAR